jgi:DNA polymerase-1
MEDKGVRLFNNEVIRLTKEYKELASQKIKEAEKFGGKDLNFRSSKQMHQKFYIEKGYKPKLNDKGNMMLDGKKLVELAAIDPLAQIILDFRGANHMLSNFFEPYSRFKVRESDGEWVLHPSFKQCGPVTGRFACGDPNLMCVASEDTIRNKTRVEYKPKHVLGPRKGYVWYLPDYKQIEVWVFAFMAQEKDMMGPLLQGFDFHGAISKVVWGHEKDYEEKYDSYRKRAKLILFCKLYGGGVKKIASLLEIYKDDKGDLDIPKAQKFLDDYDSKFPGVPRFQKRMMNKIEREGRIYNPFGRMYSIDPNYSYKGVNYIIQGTCADIMKCAMLNVDKLFRTKWPGCHILITLHDELICEIPAKYHSKKLMRELITAMQGDFHTVLGIPQPLPVSMEIATKCWAETKEVKL